MNDWKKIWNNKKVVSPECGDNEFDRFCELKKANGFDVAVGNADLYYSSFYNGWIDFYNTIIELIGKDINSVYEVGCGNGVNLFMFKNRLGENATFGGIDYSISMIESAKITIGSNDLVCGGADEVDSTCKYDIVMSESVFQYFESLEYSEKVLRTMIEKSNKLTYVGEMHDKKFENELLEYRRMTIEDYDKKYEGLNKLFFDRQWVVNIASEYNKKVLFTYIDNPEYINGKYEFNCFIY